MYAYAMIKMFTKILYLHLVILGAVVGGLLPAIADDSPTFRPIDYTAAGRTGIGRMSITDTAPDARSEPRELFLSPTGLLPVASLIRCDVALTKPSVLAQLLNLSPISDGLTTPRFLPTPPAIQHLTQLGISRTGGVRTLLDELARHPFAAVTFRSGRALFGRVVRLGSPVSGREFRYLLLTHVGQTAEALQINVDTVSGGMVWADQPTMLSNHAPYRHTDLIIYRNPNSLVERPDLAAWLGNRWVERFEYTPHTQGQQGQNRGFVLTTLDQRGVATAQDAVTGEILIVTQPRVIGRWVEPTIRPANSWHSDSASGRLWAKLLTPTTEADDETSGYRLAIGIDGLEPWAINLEHQPVNVVFDPSGSYVVIQMLVDPNLPRFADVPSRAENTNSHHWQVPEKNLRTIVLHFRY